jgi:hypothetical protein
VIARCFVPMEERENRDSSMTAHFHRSWMASGRDDKLL